MLQHVIQNCALKQKVNRTQNKREQGHNMSQKFKKRNAKRNINGNEKEQTDLRSRMENRRPNGAELAGI